MDPGVNYNESGTWGRETWDAYHNLTLELLGDLVMIGNDMVNALNILVARKEAYDSRDGDTND